MDSFSRLFESRVAKAIAELVTSPEETAEQLAERMHYARQDVASYFAQHDITRPFSSLSERSQRELISAARERLCLS